MKYDGNASAIWYIRNIAALSTNVKIGQARPDIFERVPHYVYFILSIHKNISYYKLSKMLNIFTTIQYNPNCGKT